MSDPLSKRILISEPQGLTSELQFDNAKPYLPYMWAVLKSFYERYGKDPEAFEWFDPIWRNDLPQRWATWIGRVVVGGSSSAMNNLQQLRLRQPQPTG